MLVAEVSSAAGLLKVSIGEDLVSSTTRLVSMVDSPSSSSRSFFNLVMTSFRSLITGLSSFNPSILLFV